MKALRNAIYAKCAGAALNTLTNGQIYHGKAPAGTRYPYVVFSRVTSIKEKTFTEKFDCPLIQFSAFSADQSSSTEIYDIAEAIEALYDECSLSISGSTLLRMYLENTVGPFEDDSISQDGADGGWACHLDFNLLVDET